MRKIVFIFTIVILYSFTENKTKAETGFAETCSKLASNFTKFEHGKMVYNSTSKKYIEPKNFAKILLNITNYDLIKTGKVEKANSEKTQITIWKSDTPNGAVSVEKKTFIATGKECKGITITDYSLRRSVKPKYVYLRIIEGEFEELTIDKTKYHSFFESRLVGADEAIKEFYETEK